MSETMTMPRPGGTEALKQRAEAYELARELPRALEEAGILSTGGWYKQAKAELEPVLEAVLRNPVAQEMLNRFNPEVLPLAQRDIAEYRAEAPKMIDLVSLGDWHMDSDGMTESRMVVGKSERGFHAAVEVSYRGGDGGDLAWSRPLKDEETARKVAMLHEQQLGWSPHNGPMRAQIEKAEEARIIAGDRVKTVPIEKMKASHKPELAPAGAKMPPDLVPLNGRGMEIVSWGEEKARGTLDMRPVVGKSAEGWHAGLKIQDLFDPNGGGINWSQAVPDRAVAEKVATKGAEAWLKSNLGPELDVKQQLEKGLAEDRGPQMRL